MKRYFCLTCGYLEFPTAEALAAHIDREHSRKQGVIYASKEPPR